MTDLEMTRAMLTRAGLIWHEEHAPGDGTYNWSMTVAPTMAGWTRIWLDSYEQPEDKQSDHPWCHVMFWFTGDGALYLLEGHE